MPLISDERLIEKLEHPSNIARDRDEKEIFPEVTGKVLPMYRGGRKEGDNNIPPVVRTLIAATSQLEGTKSASEAFGVSQVTANNLQKGYVNGLNKDLEFASRVDEMVGKVNEKALDILVNSLGLMEDQSEVAALPIRARAAFAKDIASIHQSLRKNETIVAGQNNLILIAPTQRNMEDVIADPINVIRVNQAQR